MNMYPDSGAARSTPQGSQTLPGYTPYMAQPGACPSCSPAGQYLPGEEDQTGLMPDTGMGQMTAQGGRTAAGGDFAPILPSTQPMPVTTQTVLYLNGYLRTQIGRKVTVNFLIGTGTQVDRTGTLLAVGADYIVINEVETDDIVICDFYTIKFVRVYF